MRYVPALDGLRAVAILLVLLLHCDVPGFQAGYVGVDLFFVLSGYLITRILIGEYQATGAISLRRFYWRRALRLYPALLLMLAVYAVIAPRLWPHCPVPKDVLVAGTYMMDYAVPFGPWGNCLQHTWSLGVEEKFYLIWPAVLIACLSRYPLARIARFVLIGLAVAFAWQLFNVAQGWPVYSRFDTRLPGLLCGCWLAVVVMQSPAWMHALPVKRIAWGSVALLAYAVWTGAARGPTVMQFTIPVVEIAAVGLILGASALPLAQARLVQIGKLSYGMYLWHALVASYVHLPWQLKFPVVLVASVLLAAISYATVERLARRYRPSSDQAIADRGEGIDGAGAARLGADDAERAG